MGNYICTIFTATSHIGVTYSNITVYVRFVTIDYITS